MKKQEVVFQYGTEERVLNEGELIKLRLEMVFQAISGKRQIIRIPLSDRVQLHQDLETFLRN